MHILLTNDDGPPSSQSSPYVHSLINALNTAGHVVSVILPHTQRSWIGKAHLANVTLKPTYYTPGTAHKDDGTVHAVPQVSGSSDEEWILIDGTPASCVQIGLFHYFTDRGPVDLVISGPNYGRNTTALFALSSGTLGGALEAAGCGKKAIAVSYAFNSREHNPVIIDAASKHAVRVVENLYKNWDKDTDLYSINLPLIEGIENNKVLYTHMLQSTWSTGSIYAPVEVDDVETAEEREMAIREAEEDGSNKRAVAPKKKHVNFKFAPRFTDVYKSVEDAPEGNDGWAVVKGYTSVTALRANFMHTAKVSGEIKLDVTNSTNVTAIIDYEDEYVQPLILFALKTRLPPGSVRVVRSYSEARSSGLVVQISSYETIAFERLLSEPTKFMANAYVIRKALIRKHFLSQTISTWTTKHPDSILKTHVKPTHELELDYVDYLDEALSDAYELREGLEQNEELSLTDHKWWILKPSMSDRGQGIRLFSTLAGLTEIFESWENDDSASEDTDGGDDKADNFIMTSQLRHFVAQEYLMNPLLIDKRKFHIRAYVLAVGALKVYVYKPMLALFAADPYVQPSTQSADLASHLTNTCLQDGTRIGSVRKFWYLPDDGGNLSQKRKESVWDQILKVTGEVFEAAARGQMVHFQTLPNAFEIFGVDYLVDADGQVCLLEINAFPDFKQTGDDLKVLIAELFEDIVTSVIAPFVGLSPLESESRANQLHLSLSLDLGRS